MMASDLTNCKTYNNKTYVILTSRPMEVDINGRVKLGEESTTRQGSADIEIPIRIATINSRETDLESL